MRPALLLLLLSSAALAQVAPDELGATTDSTTVTLAGTQTLTGAKTFSSTVSMTGSAGAYALRLLVDTLRLDLGTGSDDYLYSDGSGVGTPGYLFTVAGYFYIGQSQIVAGTTSTSTIILRSGTAATQYVSVQNGFGTEEVAINAGGGIRLNVPGGGSKPSCDATIRGELWYTAGAGGAADLIQMCSKSAADAYAWRALDAAIP